MSHKLLFIIKERRFLPPDDPLYHIPISKITLYLSIQILGVVICVAISQTIAAIGFPVLICLLIPIRWIYFPRWFSISELDAMDALTADNPVVLASFGGRPSTSGGMSVGIGGESREYTAKKGGAERQRAGSFHR